jgi:predicted hydrolase (HD superfamily)
VRALSRSWGEGELEFAFVALFLDHNADAIVCRTECSVKRIESNGLVGAEFRRSGDKRLNIENWTYLVCWKFKNLLN